MHDNIMDNKGYNHQRIHFSLNMRIIKRIKGLVLDAEGHINNAMYNSEDGGVIKDRLITIEVMLDKIVKLMEKGYAKDQEWQLIQQESGGGREPMEVLREVNRITS